MGLAIPALLKLGPALAGGSQSTYNTMRFLSFPRHPVTKTNPHRLRGIISAQDTRDDPDSETIRPPVTIVGSSQGLCDSQLFPSLGEGTLLIFRKPIARSRRRSKFRELFH